MANGNEESGASLPIQIGDLEIRIPEGKEDLVNVLADLRMLGDRSVGPKLYGAEKTLEKSKTKTFNNGLSLTLGASVGGQLAITALNDADDVDPDKIVVPADDKAWLKYEVIANTRGSVKAAGKVAGLDATLGLEGDAGLRLLQYRAHPPEECLGEAVGDDLYDYLFPFRAEDIKKLRRNDTQGDDALAYIVRGSLAFTAELAWSDVVTTTVQALDDALGQSGLASFEVALGAKASFNLGVRDDYRLVFRPTTTADPRRGGWIGIELRKSEQNRTGVSLALTVGAGFQNPDDLATAINTYLEGRLGIDDAQDALARIDSAVSFNDLSGTEKKAAEALAEKVLGLDPKKVHGDFASFKKDVEGKIGELEDVVKKAIAARLQAAFTFAYTRVKTDEVLLACEIAAKNLDDLLPSLLVGKLRPLTDELAKDDAEANGYLLVRYLETTTKTRTTAFGFSLSLGDFKAFGRKTKTVEETTEKNVDGAARQSFDGRASYAGQWGSEGYEYVFDLSAAMKSFTAAPRVADFELEIGLSWLYSAKKLDWETVDNALDVASTWGLLEGDDLAAAATKIWRKAGGQNTKIEVALSLGDAAVHDLLRVERDDFNAAWAQAMAAALPRVYLTAPKAHDTGLRGDVSRRLETYGEAARFTFEQSGGVDPSAVLGRVDYPEGTDEQLRNIDAGKGPGHGVVGVWSLENLWRLDTTNRRVLPSTDAKDFFNHVLTPLRQGDAAPKTIARAFEKGQKLVASRPYTTRLVGTVLADLLADRGTKAETSVKVTLLDTNDQPTGSLVLVG